MKITALKNNPNNPRIIKDDKFKKLVQSISDFPEMMEKRPIVCVTDTDGKLYPLGGNMRLKALNELNYKEIPDNWVTLADEWSIEKRKEFVIKDNVGYGEWNWDDLANEWDEENLNDWGLDLPVDFNAEVLEAQDDFFEVPDGGIETDIVIGDIFDIGDHRLICGDSTQTDTFDKLMQGEIGDMVLTDPPYNVSYQGGTKDKLTIINDSMDNDDFYKFLYDFYTAQSTVLKKGGVIYIWHASSEIINFAKAFVDAGFLLKQQLIWLKSSLVMGRQDYQWKHEPCLEGVNAESWEIVKEHEPCLYGWKSGAGHYWKGGRKQTTILEFDKPSRNGEHPTMKPIALFGLQITNSTKINEIIIDAFGGSGTTMVACEQLKRKSRIIEFDPKYCQVIVDRMKKLNPNLEIKRNGMPYEIPHKNIS
jgi:site-specific DNA-methyltransferase (adenine-specific)